MSRIKGIAALLLTAMIWGSSFPAIKVVVSFIDEATYTWIRSAIALLGITPYIIYYYWKHELHSREVTGGLITGVVYSIGLWLQGWGTRFTTASNSAFITGLNVVFVHAYDAMMGREYTLKALISLLTSMMGLYLLTQPKGGVGIGELLVLVSAVFWAAQVILVSNFSSSDPLIFTYYEMIPALAFITLSFNIGSFSLENVVSVLPLLAYLGLICSDVAFAYQVYGQRWLKPYQVALIFLLEPVFAALFSAITLNERLNVLEGVGAVLIIIGMAFAMFSKKKFKVLYSE